MSTGDVVVSVDGVHRVAAASEVPFWRSLGRNDAGEDVVALQLLLESLGLYEGEVDGRYGPAMVSAVNRFAEGLGVVRPQGVFDPGWVVWLPLEPFPVERVEAHLGRPAPGPGEVLLEGPSAIAETVMTDVEGRRLGLEGGWLLELDGVDYEMVDGEFTADAEVSLAEVLDSETSELFGRVRRAHPVPVVEIPAAAVTSSLAGGLCVWVPAGESFSPVPVTLDGGRVARVFVSAGLEPGDEILINPGEVVGDPICP